MLQTVEIRMRADNPEKGKLDVFKFITRKLHPYDWTCCPAGWVKWRNHKWAVYHAHADDNLYDLGEMVHK